MILYVDGTEIRNKREKERVEKDHNKDIRNYESIHPSIARLLLPCENPIPPEDVLTRIQGVYLAKTEIEDHPQLSFPIIESLQDW